MSSYSASLERVVQSCIDNIKAAQHEQVVGDHFNLQLRDIITALPEAWTPKCKALYDYGLPSLDALIEATSLDHHRAQNIEQANCYLLIQKLVIVLQATQIACQLKIYTENSGSADS